MPLEARCLCARFEKSPYPSWLPSTGCVPTPEVLLCKRMLTRYFSADCRAFTSLSMVTAAWDASQWFPAASASK